MNSEPWSMSWLVDKAWIGAVAFVTFVWKMNDRQLTANKKSAEDGIASARREAADAMVKHQAQDDKEFQALHEEQTRQRGYIAKIFDQMRDESRRSEERHLELIQRAHDGQRELLMALNSKADK